MNEAKTQARSKDENREAVALRQLSWLPELIAFHSHNGLIISHEYEIVSVNSNHWPHDHVHQSMT